MSQPEGIYERLGREQQASAQRFIFRFVFPLLCVAGPLFIWADGPNYRSVFMTVGGYSGLVAILVDAWRRRRGLPSFLWTPEQRRALHEVRRQKRRQVPLAARSLTGVTCSRERRARMLRLRGVRRVPALLLGLALLVACGSEQGNGEQEAASRDGSVVAPNAGFGGVVEVTFSTGDAASQDALARDCGLTDGKRAGQATSPLPPSIRWYPQPPDAGAAIACMRRQKSVLRASLPL